MTMLCNHCGAEIPENSRFCGVCGRSLEMEPAREAEETVQQPVSEEQMGAETPDTVIIGEPEPPVQTQEQTGADIPEIPQPPAAAMEEPPVMQEPVAVNSVSQPNVYEIPAAMPQPEYIAASQSVPVPQTSGTVPSIENNKNTKMEKMLRPVKTASFFWLQLLFAVPVVGAVCGLIWLCFKKSNISRRNYVKSVLIWKLVFILVAVVFVCFYLLFRNRLALGNLLESILQDALTWVRANAAML